MENRPAHSPAQKKADEQVKIQTHLSELTSTARTLNELSDQLTKEVEIVESALNRLGLGVRASVKVEILDRSRDGSSERWTQLSYGKSKNGWGFLIEEIQENINYPEADRWETWPFKEAPREYRIKAVNRIPDLLEELAKRANETAATIKANISMAKDLVANFPGTGGPR